MPVRAVQPRWLALLPDEGRDLTSPYPPIGPEDWLRYHRTGDRSHYEALVAERHRLLSAAVLAAGAGQEAGVARAVEGVLAFCGQASWCWPAHDDAPARGQELPDADRPFLDLGAGEVAAQLAWTDHLVGPLLESHSTGLRQRIRDEVEHRVLRPFLERDDWHWLGLDGDVHNWLPWIAGNVLTAAVALVEGSERRASLVAAARDCLQRYADQLPPDGAIDEGYGYWWNGACRTLEALELLAEGADWVSHPALRATISFPADMHLGYHWWVNVADGSARPETDLAWPALFRAARAAGNRRATALALSRRTGRATSEIRRLGRLVMELADEQWWSAPKAEAESPREAWYPSVELLVARQRAGSRTGLALAAKGGHNGEHHNHNDVGSFVVALDGVPVVVDVGRPTYTAATFSEQRYSIWTMQSLWHNVPVLRGRPQSPGSEFAARDVSVTLADDAAGLELDLAGAYPECGIERWQRRLLLDRRSGRVTCSDAWRASGESAERSANTLVVAGEVVAASPTEVLVRPVAGTRCLRIRSEAPMELERRELDDEMLTRVWGSCVNRITIDLENAIIGQASLLFEAVEQEDS
ncbi:heparinase II/III family protein [Tessaracoccus terricola]